MGQLGSAVRRKNRFGGCERRRGAGGRLFG